MTHAEVLAEVAAIVDQQWRKAIARDAAVMRERGVSEDEITLLHTNARERWLADRFEKVEEVSSWLRGRLH
jgi:hypothetical protein